MNGKSGTTDYRAKLIEATTPNVGGWVGPRRIGELLDGFAAQVIRDHQKREHLTGAPLEQVLADALVKGLGYTSEAAVSVVNGYRSDHDSYRVLADVVNELIHELSDSDDWDGDDSEEYLMTRFLTWLPDIVRHADADKLRTLADGADVEGQRSFASGILSAAEFADPFKRNGDGQWIRKSDHAAVPWPVVKE